MQHKLHMILFVGLMLLQLVSCERIDGPSPVQMPQFKYVKAEVDKDSFTLSAELETEEGIVSECGFLVGKTSYSLQKHKASLNYCFS